MFQIASRSRNSRATDFISVFCDPLKDSSRDFSFSRSASLTSNYFEVNKVSFVVKRWKSWAAFSNLKFISRIFLAFSFMYFKLTKKGDNSSSIFLASRNSYYSLTNTSLFILRIFLDSSFARSYSVSDENSLVRTISLTTRL